MPVQQLPEWVLIFERLGPGSAILVFVGATLWKLLPGVSRLMISWRKQSDAVTAAVPVALGTLHELVRHVERVAEHVTRPDNEESAWHPKDAE
jgi:hypothetical protein